MKKIRFFLPFRSACTIFAFSEDRLRFNNAQTKKIGFFIWHCVRLVLSLPIRIVPKGVIQYNV
jgi:hypothetical protein